MELQATLIVAIALGTCAAAPAQGIDTSETRVQTTLDPGTQADWNHSAAGRG